MTVKLVEIDAIKVNDRLREDMGDIAGLADSIKRYGLLHPIVIDDQKNLVAGARRLAACKSLGWTLIAARDLGTLSKSERREIELEENLRRKDLTPYERSKTIKEIVEVAREIAREEFRPESGQKPVQEEFRPHSGQNSADGPGRPPEPDSFRAVEERTGIPRSTAHEAVQHVATADQYPFMQSPEWKQYHVLEAKEHLDKLPEEDRATVTAIASEPGVPPQTAIQMFKRMAGMRPDERAEVRGLYASSDPRDKSLAKTTLAELPPEPDPRLIVIDSAIRELSRCARAFPQDPFTVQIEAVILTLKNLADAMKEAHNAKASHRRSVS